PHVAVAEGGVVRNDEGQLGAVVVPGRLDLTGPVQLHGDVGQVLSGDGDGVTAGGLLGPPGEGRPGILPGLVGLVAEGDLIHVAGDRDVCIGAQVQADTD